MGLLPLNAGPRGHAGHQLPGRRRRDGTLVPEQRRRLFLVMPAGCRAPSRFRRHGDSRLQRRGLFRTEYEATALRDNLGLPRPVSRFQAARSVEAAQ
jgi:hypothetical protein